MTDASTTGAVERLAQNLDLTADTLRDHDLIAQAVNAKFSADTLRALVAERDAAIQRAEAADSLITELRHRYAAGQVALTEARAQAALEWQAGRDAAKKEVLEASIVWSGDHDEANWQLADWVGKLTPPADLSAALTVRLDAEWNKALSEVCRSLNLHDGPASDTIRALRRAAPTEGEA